MDTIASPLPKVKVSRTTKPRKAGVKTGRERTNRPNEAAMTPQWFSRPSANLQGESKLTGINISGNRACCAVS
jgi:hypothetical protein